MTGPGQAAAAADGVTAVTMPKWGLSMQTGKITGWLVAEGDAVAPGDELADIDTDKITGTLESDAAGTVRRLIAKVGEDVPVSAAIALIAAPEAADLPDAVLDDMAAAARAAIDAGLPGDETAAPAVESVTVGGRKISYATAGPAAETAGDVVLFVHGYGGDRNSWLFLQAPLAARYRTCALDLPGHGSSAKDAGDGSLDLLADAVLGVLDAVAPPGPSATGTPGAARPPRVHLVGHSLGGAVALAAAAKTPERVASLTLFAPAGFGTAINAAYLRGFAAAQTRRELRPLVAQLFADPALVTRQVIDDLLAYKRLDGTDAALATLADTLLDQSGAQRLDSAAPLRALAERALAGNAAGRPVPVTVVWGAADQIIPPDQARAVADAAPDAHLRLIDNAGHMPHMERPAESQSAIEETIARAT